MLTAEMQNNDVKVIDIWHRTLSLQDMHKGQNILAELIGVLLLKLTILS